MEKILNIQTFMNVKFLLKAGADRDSVDENEVFKALVKKGATPSAGDSALILAVRYGNEDIFESLLRVKNVHLDAKNDEGETALAIAVSKKNLRMTTILIIIGADTDASNNKGDSIVMLAVRNWSREIILALLKKGADSDKANSVGLTPQEEAKRAGMENVFIKLVGQLFVVIPRSWRNLYSKQSTSPPIIEGMTDDKAIASVFKNHFQAAAQPNNDNKVAELNRNFKTSKY